MTRCTEVRLLSALLVLIASASLTYATEFTATIQSAGPRANRINLVFLSEGYMDSEQALFLQRAQTVWQSMTTYDPYNEYRYYYNVDAVFATSAESGSTHPHTATDCPGSSTTYSHSTNLQSSFDGETIHRLLEVNDALGLALLARNRPDWDLAIVLVNDAMYGGSGGQLAVASADPNAVLVAIHESGHAFADLDDEYETYAPYPDYELANTERDTVRALIKWNDWIADTTPVPTPETPAYGAVVGLFEGAHYHPTGYYRPQLNCIMRSLGATAFCKVCRQEHVRAMYRLVSVVDSTLPPSASPIVWATGNLAFRVAAQRRYSGHRPAFAWALDGALLTTYHDSMCTLYDTSATTTIGTHTLTLDVRDTSGFVIGASDTTRQTRVTWTIHRTTAAHVEGSATDSRRVSNARSTYVDVLGRPVADFAHVPTGLYFERVGARFTRHVVLR